ncbi:MAG: sulfatase-like hydrolase/transferase [Proteobacteria bacterium]|nr:sulfatase-like hydrolase/transferase [Pseudomonadota bacterium]
MSTHVSSQTKTGPAFVSAIYFLLIYLVYSLVLRVANFLTLARDEDFSIHLLGPPFSLPFILGEELVIGIVFALMLGILWRIRILRVLWLAMISLYLFFLAFNQLAYKYFFSHIDYILYSSSHDIVRMWSSVTGSFDAFFAMDIVVALVCTVLLFLKYRPLFVRTLAEIVAGHRLVSSVVVFSYMAATVAFGLLSEQHGLHRSFPGTYASSYIQAHLEDAEEERSMAASTPVAEPIDRPIVDAGHSTDELASARASIEAVSRKLNIVWYLMESASYRETSLSPSNKYDTTPFLKELAKKSLVFTNYYTSFAASTRAFFSCLTGLYPYVDRSADVTKYSRLNVPTLVDILHQEGYSTAFFSSSDTLFDSLDTFLSNLSYDHYMDKNLVPKKELGNVSVGSWGVDEEIVIDRALDWIAEVKDSDKPFYVNYNAVYPHHPFRVPSQYRDLYKMDWGEEDLKSRYRASLYYADMSVKRFFEGLKRLGVAENTLFIVTSDHGEAFGDLHKKNLIHAEYCYDEDSHIFLMLHNPEALGPPMQSARLGTHADLLPTLLDVLRIDRDLRIDGQSLISSGYKERMVFCCSRRQLGVRDGNLKLVTLRSDKKVELYDLSDDPEEQNDISRNNKDKVKTYEKVVRDWKVSVLRAYKDRVGTAGLSENEIQKLAKQTRSKIFAGVRARMASAAICNGGTCASAGGEASFSKGQTLTVQVRIRRPANVGLQVILFDPKGTRILKQKTSHQNIKETISANLSANLFQTAGRYRARVLLLSSHAVHDSSALYFRIRE